MLKIFCFHNPFNPRTIASYDFLPQKLGLSNVWDTERVSCIGNEDSSVPARTQCSNCGQAVIFNIDQQKLIKVEPCIRTIITVAYSRPSDSRDNRKSVRHHENTTVRLEGFRENGGPLLSSAPEASLTFCHLLFPISRSLEQA